MMTSKGKTKPLRKPRQEYIYGTTRGEVSEIGLSVDPLTGEVEFLQDMVSTYTQVAYNRRKGEKVISRIPSKSTRHTFESDDVLFRDYAEIFAVDTSTASLVGDDFSVTAVVNVQSFFTVDPNGIATKVQDAFCTSGPFCFLYRRPDGNPETLGWCLLIQELVSSNAYRKCPSIGIVVDSELGRTKDINATRAPIRGRLMLPASMTLIYATDAAAHTAVNYLIRVANSAAAQIRDEVLAGRITIPTSKVTGPPFKGHVKLIGLNSTVL